MAQERPDGAGHLRRKGDDRDVGMSARQQSAQPRANRRIRLCQRRHGRPRALDQHLAQVATAPFRDPEEPRLSSRRRLAGHQTQPRGEIAAFRERRGVADRSHKSGGVKRPDAGNAGEPLGVSSHEVLHP